MTPESEAAGNGHRIMLLGPGPNVRGGIAQFNRHLAEALADAGASACVQALSPVYPRWTRPGRQRLVEAEPLREGVALAPTRLVAWRPWTWPAAIRELRRTRPAVVVLQWWHPMFAPCYAALAVAARRIGARVAFVCHNAEPHERFPLSGALTALALRWADALLVLSDAVGNELSRRFPGKPVVRLGHPPYASLARPADPSIRKAWARRVDAGDEPIVLFFGNVRPYKGLRDLVDAFALVRAETPAVLVVAGTFFESVDFYRQQVAELGLEDHVRLFPEYVADAEVGAVLGLADVVVLPYRAGSQTGVAPLAAELGRPVVATDVAGITEGAPAARTVPARNPRALATAIVESLRHPIPPGRSTASWKQWAEAVLDLTGRGGEGHR